MAEWTTKLSKPVTSYTVFEENQVLTAGQLNEVVEYLDRQDRLTRARLFGVGIVCGLELALKKSAVTLGSGVAVTSDGDLLAVDALQGFTRYRELEDRDAKYPLFRNDGTLLPLYELLSTGEGNSLSQFAANTGKKLEDMVALLYLENYPFDPDVCTGSGCDNRGQQERHNLKLLLADAEHAKLLAGDLSLADRYPLLPDYYLPRVILKPADAGTYPALSGLYLNLVTSQVEGLAKVLKSSWHPAIRPLVEDLYPAGDPTPAWELELQKVEAAVTQNRTGVQYVCDFLRDLAQAYAELKEALFADRALCAPPADLFPRHVLLGTLQGGGPRHGFYASPELNMGREHRERARFIHVRLDRMIRGFVLPSVEPKVRITPSLHGSARLGDRALPWYLKRDLRDFWSFEKRQRGQQQDTYGYHFQEVQLDVSARARAPLKFDLSDFDFFRIEGHLGNNIDSVEKALNDLIRDNNLPIQILPLQIETGTKPWKVRPIAPLRDLKALHRFHRYELLERIGNLKEFTAAVKTAVTNAKELPEKDVEADSLSYKAFVEINTAELESEVNKVHATLKRNFSQFQFADFQADYTSAISKSAGINKSVRGVSYVSAFTPYEILVNDTQFKWLGWIDDLLNRRRQRAEELSIFAKFLAEAPAMEHLGGVGRGGTFILVYSATSKQVLADFSLPYWHVDLPEADEEDDDAVPEIKPDWGKYNDFFIKPSRTKVLTEQLGKLKQNFDQFDIRLRGQEDGLKVYSNSLKAYSETVFNVVGKLPQVEGVFSGGMADARAGVLEMINNYLAKAREGTPTPEEKALAAQMEKLGTDIIIETVSEMQNKATDVLPNSRDEQVLKLAITTSAQMTDTAEKQRLAEGVKNVQGNLGVDKTIMKNMLGNMIRG